ncbi:Uncharacterised protein [Klebsiella pneumoniae]|jgi:hypothetical protein|uniref:hypothetical protein n=1 Tax=Bacteria TaxID=2 RepID=UPI000BF40C50|nr:MULTISPECIES: hypothetical protein [Bacteria]PFS61495.1 hypothetical protein COK41_18210 [Bacillus cereus]PGD49297.1 hypothetical protein COM38_27030 [Bacillus toyonensis]SWD33089.1 Uncharacterised protein [Klebsiella pneumoniae]
MLKVLRVIDFSKASNYRLIAHMSNKMLLSSDRNERAEGQKMKEILEKRGYCYGDYKPTVM